MDKHNCDLVIVNCIDFRFQKYIRSWLEKNYKEKTYDYVGYAGSTKDLAAIIKQIDISVKLHQVKEVVLIHHEDCGAYGIESTQEKHKTELLKAKNTILSKYPNLKINLFYLLLDGNFININ